MDSKEMHIQVVQARYNWLGLTPEQALKIDQYEQAKYSSSDSLYMSQWEEWDFQRHVFKDILNNDQLAVYEQALSTQIMEYEKGLAENDQQEIINVAYQQEVLDFYQHDFLPGLMKSSFFIIRANLSNSRTKIDFLKAEYKKFLYNARKELLIDHFRYYRSFSPNRLEAALLQHQLFFLFPSYSWFKTKMDEPTRAAALYVEPIIIDHPFEEEGAIITEFEKRKDFLEKVFEKYHKNRGGWHVDAGSKEEERAERLMSIVLMDKEFYLS